MTGHADDAEVGRLIRLLQCSVSAPDGPKGVWIVTDESTCLDAEAPELLPALHCLRRKVLDANAKERARLEAMDRDLDSDSP